MSDSSLKNMFAGRMEEEIRHMQFGKEKTGKGY